MNTAIKQNDTIGSIERVFAMVFPILGLAIVFWFFNSHQRGNTGFFTEEFGQLEMLALFGPIVLSMIPPVVGASLGSRNTSRPWEMLANIALAIGSIWLFFVFPFNFEHLTDVLPVFMRFPFSWITDGIARIILALQVLVAILTAGGALWKYVSFARE
jgi:hypothetical protein